MYGAPGPTVRFFGRAGEVFIDHSASVGVIGSSNSDTHWCQFSGQETLNCRQNCGGETTQLQQSSPSLKRKRATHSTASTWKQENTTDFNKRRNLVRDQGVGGSNPLAPTNSKWVYIRCSHSSQRARRMGEPRHQWRWTTPTHRKVRDVWGTRRECPRRHYRCWFRIQRAASNKCGQASGWRERSCAILETWQNNTRAPLPANLTT